MSEQENTNQEQLKAPTPQEQYGQGQYDSEGKPDMNGPQAQQILSELQRKLGEQKTPDEQAQQQQVQNQ